jgi:hypothetical protein
MGKWTIEEDDILRNAVVTNDGKNWKKISEPLPGRTDVQCLHRWQKVLKPGLVKGPWTQEEDDTVVKLVAKYGQKKWSCIAKQLKGRLGKQCRERWYNHLNPEIKRTGWSVDEDRLIIEAHESLGNRWAEIAKHLTGRTDNGKEAINYFYLSISKERISIFINHFLFLLLTHLFHCFSFVFLFQRSRIVGTQRCREY